MVDERQVRTGNHLLDTLPSPERSRLWPHLERRQHEARDVLWEPEAPIETVYFPVSGVVSLVSVMNDGPIVEVATIGNEGLVGLPIFLGASSMNGRAFYQVAGSSLKTSSATLRRFVSNGGALHTSLQRYTQALFVQIAQTAACNRVHPVDERCARWLLQTHDRVEGDSFELLQESLAQMLGIRRASVSIAARMLQTAGLIRYSRGRMTILDRDGLESASCECYQMVRREYHRLVS